MDKKKEDLEKMKINIKEYIQNKYLEKAKILIEESLKINNKDIEVYSMKSVVEIMENRLVAAEKTLKCSLEIDNKSFDILYNLGYLYEIKEKYKLAVDFYSKALIVSESEEVKSQLEEYIKNIEINNF